MANTRRKAYYARMDEGRKRVIGIIAGIIMARNLDRADDLFGGPQGSPRTDKMIAAARLVTIGIMVLLTAGTAFGQQIDPAFRGVWVLNIEKSDFGGQPEPKMEQLNWTEHGWAFAMVRADGELYADASVIGDHHGCTMVGVESNYSCEVNIVTRRHVRFKFKQGSAILRTVEIELLENDTLRTTHHVTPSQGVPYVQKTIWEKQVRK